MDYVSLLSFKSIDIACFGISESSLVYTGLSRPTLSNLTMLDVDKICLNWTLECHFQFWECQC